MSPDIENKQPETTYDEKPLFSNNRKIYVYLLFFMVFALGLGVRLIYINSESVWWDEFATVAFLEPPQAYTDSPDFSRWNQQVIRQPSSPTLRSFMEQNRMVDPAAMPLYLIAEYYWNKYISHSVVFLRVLSVLISLCALSLLFLLGKKIFNPRTGLIAAICFALSPIHVQFAKEIRMYGLMTLLSVALVYIFCRLYEHGGKRWWVLYAITALLLSWTHPFALLLPFLLGVFWLTANPKDIKRLFGWSIVNALVLLPAAIYVLSIQFWGEDSTSNWMRLPSVSELLTDMLADDAIGMTYQVNATPYLLETLLSRETALYVLSLRWFAGRLFIIGFMFALPWLFFITYFRNKQKIDSSKPAIGAYSQRWNYLLLLWLVVPPLTLYLLSMFWRPCIMPRYTVHSSLALYLLLGGAISAIPMRYIRSIFIVLICLFFGYQQLLMAGEPQHPNWYGARDHIRENAAPNDLILVHNWLWKRVFSFNMGPSPNTIGYGSTYDILAEQCAFWLDYQSKEAGTDTPVIWVVIRTEYFEQGPIIGFENELNTRKLHYSSQEYGGIQHVLVYRVNVAPDQPPMLNPKREFTGEAPKEFGDLAMEYWREGKYEIAVALADYANQIDPEYSRAWSYKGMAYKELGKQEEALAAFEQAVAIDRQDYPWSHINIAMLLVDMKRYNEAVNAALRALEVLPNDAWGYAMLGQAQLGLGEYKEAVASLQKAVELNTGDIRIPQMLEEAQAALSTHRGAHE